MKKILSVLTILLFSCDSGDLDSKKKKLDDLKNSLVETYSEIDKLEKEISELDSSYNSKNYELVSTSSLNRGLFTSKIELRGNIQSNKNVLRTHTSPVQIRSLKNEKVPIKIFAPGRTYRCDSDITHTPMFHQVEGLVVDKDISFSNLKWFVSEFCKTFFNNESLKLRFRPSFFPFTEPSAEVDVNCSRKKGKLILGEGDEWMEILGCGMVHPNVFELSGFSTEGATGFAFGIGIERLAMLKYGMPDLRNFFENDIRWLNHYGFSCFDIPDLNWD